MDLDEASAAAGGQGGLCAGRRRHGGPGAEAQRLRVKRGLGVDFEALILFHLKIFKDI